MSPTAAKWPFMMTSFAVAGSESPVDLDGQTRGLARSAAAGVRVTKRENVCRTADP